MSMGFTTPVMTFCRFEINSEFRDDGEGLKADLHFHLNVQRSINDRTAVTALRLQINQNLEERSDDAPFWLEVEYAAQFNWDEGMTEDEIDKGLRINATAVLIGYIRPMAAFLTSASSLPTYTLPFINANSLFDGAKAPERREG